MKAKRTTQLIATFGVALALLLAAGCGGGADEEPVAVVGAQPDANASITGTVTYRERIALTPGAIVTVQLRDTSLQDVASVLIAEQVKA